MKERLPTRGNGKESQNILKRKVSEEITYLPFVTSAMIPFP
ncbi:hypothetical protein [Leptospira noumeaensis]|nr:hypothetical protein [Leptospira noumeaensis]